MEKNKYVGIKSPISWFGGKYYSLKKLLPLLPPHHTYVEAFGGGASLLFAKEPSPVEVYNDIDHALYEFFMTLSDEKAFARFYRRVAVLPHSRELYNECKRTWAEQDTREERVWRWFVVARQSFAARFAGGWEVDVTESKGGMSKVVASWLAVIDRLPEAHARLQRVQIECYDWRKILDIYDTPQTCFYLDPPYVACTRRGGGYRFEMSDDDHRDLVARLLDVQGMVLLSGYYHEIYAPLEAAGWERMEWRQPCFAAARTRMTGLQGKGALWKAQMRTESVWRNPQAMRALEGGARRLL